MTDQELEGLYAELKWSEAEIAVETDPKRLAILEYGRDLTIGAIYHEESDRRLGLANVPCEDCGSTGLMHHEACINSDHFDPLNQIR